MTTYQQSETTRISGPDTADETQVHRVPPALDALSDSPVVQGSADTVDDGYSPGRQRERFGGVNWGAGFFGWMISVFVGVLLVGVVAAAVTGLGLTGEMVDGQVAEPTTPGLVAAASLFAALVVAYYAGGYVAGRMSRFDGGKQGVAVWVISLLLTGAAVGAALLFGSQSVDLGGLGLPDLLPAGLAAMQAVVAGVTALLSSLLAAVAGGKVGCRYHRKVDDAAYF
jgi:hypothetical protein